MVFDKTLDKVDNTRFEGLYGRYIIQLTKENLFDRIEVTCLMMIYHKFALLNGTKAKYLQHSQFMSLLVDLFLLPDAKIAELVLLNVVSHEKYLLPNDWIEYFTLIMTDNLELKMKFAFKVYDVSHAGFLNLEDVSNRIDAFFKGSEVDDDEAAEMRSDMLELIMAKFDKDKDNSISFQEYSDVVRQCPMLLEFLGPVFPSKQTCEVVGHCANIKKTYLHQSY